MALLDWLPKTENGPAATATVATVATRRRNSGAADSLKGSAVLFIVEGAAGEIRCWICADDEDVRLLRRSGIEPEDVVLRSPACTKRCKRGRRSGIEPEDVVLDRQEVRELVAIADPNIVSEILTFKRQLPNGRLHGEGGRR